jgi:hypothetical protein
MLIFISLSLPADGNKSHLHHAENNMPLEFVTGKCWYKFGLSPDTLKKKYR